VNFLLSLIVLFLFILLFNIKLTTAVILLPFIIVIQLIFIAGISLILSSLNVQYRDVRYITEVVLMLWFYVSPVFYPLSMVPKKFLGYYMLNPMAGIITSYRSVLINGEIPELNLILTVSIMSLLSLVIGFIIFRRHEPYFADFV
ncbi:MAG: ABC transporter permease, partial [Candidatus Altiarchaeota archaeon]|nr:ABC transporter permease [Candidatus Altiarchaeota archaeon]